MALSKRHLPPPKHPAGPTGPARDLEWKVVAVLQCLQRHLYNVLMSVPCHLAVEAGTKICTVGI